MAKVRFGDVVKEVKINIDRSTDTHEYYIAGEHMESENIHLTKRGTFEESDVGPAFIRLFRPGQVLYGSRRTYLKKVAVADFEGITSNTTFVLETKDQNVLMQELLPFLMLTDSFTEYTIRKSKGSTNPYILFSDLCTYEFELPTLDVQKRLVEKLQACDRAKEAYKHLLHATDDLVKSQFIEMFGDPINNDRGWRYVKFPDITTIVLGSTPKTSQPEYWDGNVKWISPAEMTDDSFYIYDTVKHITEEGVKSAGIKPFPAGTVLFSTRAPIGKTAIAGCEMYCNQGFKNFICGSDLNPVYLFYLLRMKKDYFDSLGSGTTFRELSRKAIEQISISVPPMGLQNCFEKFYKQSDKSKFELKQSIERIDNLIKSLIQQN